MATLSGMVVDVKNPVYDYAWLCDMMRLRKIVHIVNRTNGQTFEGLINGIRPEDGSGNNWLVTLNNNLKDITIFVRAM